MSGKRIGTDDTRADALKRIADVFPLVTARGGDVAELARKAGVSFEIAQHALDHDAEHLLDARATAESDGSLLKPTASRLSLAMLEALEASMVAGELDADDINNLLPKVHRVVEHADRIEAGRGGNDSKLATFHVTFINGGMQGRVVLPDAAEVVDVEPLGGGD